MEVAAEITRGFLDQHLVLGEDTSPQLGIAESSVLGQVCVDAMVQDDKLDISRAWPGLANEKVSRVGVCMDEALLKDHVDKDS